MRFVYVATRGAEDPTLASIPFHLAVNGSVEVGHDVTLLLVAHSAEIVHGDNPEKLEGLGVPPMRELLAKARDHNVPVYV
jgi:predicted peroxiredoxin